MSRLTALEFYSGIGGMRFALAQADPTAKILDAFDINHVANMVYQHTFGDAPRQVNLEHITAADLDSYAANLWLLAPPCQPYTRQGLQLGAQDARSRSFLHLLHIIASMQQHKQHPGGQQEQQWPEMLQTGTTPFGQRQQLVLGHGQATSHQGVMQSGVNGLQVIQEFAAC
eukprot:GHRR01036359.1.p1 GENE.GHRR01036359.1~~GHRR01036359.1.p1  ORF type:complete len:171 (+),score=57.31 GHRR01036359.1:136-648(+)